jgi:ATP-dependent Clp protease ATP-binding subunit ClpA
LAAGLGAERVEPVHVAIALPRNGDGAANVALERMKCDTSRVLAALEALAPQGGAVASPDAAIERSPTLQEVLVAAYREQRESHAPVLGTHHLLLGLLSRPEIEAAFAAHGITADQFRTGARRVIG